jgi:hypothetical protein
MSLILSWVFGWILGLTAPVLIALGASYVILFTKLPIKRYAFDALIVAGCWAGMTLITQSAVGEAVRHERAAVDAAVAAEQRRQTEAGAKALDALQAQLDQAQADASDADHRADDLAAWILAHPIAGRGATQRDLDALK